VNRELVRKIADAVLYEGYMLYPYRPSAIKNRQRWSFGILYPPAYAEVRDKTERCTMHSECLLETTGSAALQLQLRFLHLLSRQVAKPSDGRFEPVPSLEVEGQLIESWDEGVERSVDLELTLAFAPPPFPFHFPGSSETQLLRDGLRQLAGIVRRTQHEISGTVSISSESIRPGLLKLTVEVTNTTPFEHDPRDRNLALTRSLLSAHTILSVSGGQFVSLLDPPEELRDAVRACTNLGNFPVLAGDPPQRDLLLCSPIVLYDYPQIAPESATDFYDATEMDEMLTLRVMTLTDDEKNEMRHADDHVRNLLERTEQSAREQLMKTHGAIRGLRPVREEKS
jgi:hydrogenase maturation protease